MSTSNAKPSGQSGAQGERVRGVRRPTMRDVAELAGVSLKTVSRVVNGEAGVTAGLEAKVNEAVYTLRYQPDDRARYLRRTAPTTRSLGYVQMDVTNPFFAAVYRGLEDVARAQGYLVLAGSSDADVDREQTLIETFIARRVDGLVIASGRPDPTLLSNELAHGTPVVFIDQDPGIPGVDVVRTDHYLGARKATRHLIDHGHRRIAFLGDNSIYYSADERRRGFVDAMNEAGLTPDLVITELTSPDLAAEAANRLITGPDRPTALFTAQNFVTLGAVTALHKLGVAQTVAVVGFDDVEMADLVQPPLTVVAQDPSALGSMAAQLLFERLQHPDGVRRRMAREPELIPRGSGELRPSDR